MRVRHSKSSFFNGWLITTILQGQDWDVFLSLFVKLRTGT